LSNGIGLAVDDHEPSFLKCDYLPAHPGAFRAPGGAEHNKRVAPRARASANSTPGRSSLNIGLRGVTLLAGTNEIAWHFVAL
jgi:hypothetical protein